MAVWIARTAKLKKRNKKKKNKHQNKKNPNQPAMSFIHILGNCFFPVLFSHGLFSPPPHQCSPVLTNVRASPLSAAQGGKGCRCPLLRDWARQRRSCKQPGAQAESPESPVMGVHGTCLCMFKASLLPTSVKAVGTWHFCKSDFQVFSRHWEKKKTHLWATCSQTSWRSRHRFAQTSSLWRIAGVPSKPKAQTPSMLLIAYLTCTTSSRCFYRKCLERRGNSWWIIHCVPSQLYCSLSSTGRVICTTTSHSPNASENKGSLSAAVYPKDRERAAGGVGETAGVWDPTQCNPFSESRGISGQR